MLNIGESHYLYFHTQTPLAVLFTQVELCLSVHFVGKALQPFTRTASHVSWLSGLQTPQVNKYWFSKSNLQARCVDYRHWITKKCWPAWCSKGSKDCLSFSLKLNCSCLEGGNVKNIGVFSRSWMKLKEAFQDLKFGHIIHMAVRWLNPTPVQHLRWCFLLHTNNSFLMGKQT